MHAEPGEERALVAPADAMSHTFLNRIDYCNGCDYTPTTIYF